MLASAIIDRVTIILQDETNVRWPRAELLKWLNDSQREIVLARPDSLAENATITLVAGSKQSIPNTAIQLLDVVRNVNGRSIRLVPRSIMDAQQPDWHQQTQSAVIKHYMFDARDPKHFYVYPPASSGAQVEAIYSTAPADVASEANAISLNDVYANAMTDYILYRAYLKDADYAGNAQRAAAHYSAFAQSIQAKTQTDLSVSPNAAKPG